jgi:hypothetical protein
MKSGGIVGRSRLATRERADLETIPHQSSPGRPGRGFRAPSRTAPGRLKSSVNQHS